MPYEPGTQFRGDAYIFQGGQATGSALANYTEQFLDRQRQIQDAGKAADFYVKANPSALDQMGVHAEEWKTLGARDKANAVAGYTKGLATQEVAARLSDFAAQAAERQQEAAASQDAGQVLRDYANPPAMVQDTPQARLAYALGNMRPGASVGRALPKALDSLARFGNITGEDLTPGTYSVPETGAVFAYRGKQFLPAGYAAGAGNQPQAVPQADADGNVLGWSIMDPRGHTIFHPNKQSSGSLKQAVDANTGQPIGGFYVDEDGKLHDTRSALSKQGFAVGPNGQISVAAPQGAPAGAPAGAGGGAPAAGKVAGKAIAGDRVTVEKDGKKFTVPKSQLEQAKAQGYNPVEE